MALSNKFTQPEAIQKKNHFKYFLEYLGEGLKAKSIVIDEKYVSKDYLHDYAMYYSLCFEDYSKYCDRVHFFKTTITEDQVNRAITNHPDIAPDFWENYLGFIVVKPIPHTMIGFTVLKNYNSEKHLDGRDFWGVRKYKMHFFGKEIEFDSLAFQEQDTLAACATTAIWSMLNKASLDSHTILKSPSQITRDADTMSQDGSRLFPNKGLSVSQICQSILNSGLVSEVKKANVVIVEEYEGEKTEEPVVSCLYAKKIINAYSPIGIPIILVIKVPDGEEHGLHAITVSGFKKGKPEFKKPQKEPSWYAEYIDRLYAHDDQFGPFVRVDFNGEVDIITPWTEIHPASKQTRISSIVVPLYPKVRISYEDIEAIIEGLDKIMAEFFDAKTIYDLVWDIKIDFSEHFKEAVNKGTLDERKKADLLRESMPKYLWIATSYIGEHKVFEFTFDATGISSGMIGRNSICYLPISLQTIFKKFLELNAKPYQDKAKKWNNVLYYQFLISSLEGDSSKVTKAST